MLKKKYYNLIYLLLPCILAFTACRHSNTITSDKARLNGKYAKEIYRTSETAVKTVRIIFDTHFLEDYVREVILNDDGTFVFGFPIVCPTSCKVGLDGYYAEVCLIPGKETAFEVNLDKSGKRILTMVKGAGFNENEMMFNRENFNKILNEVQSDWTIQSEMQATEYDKYIFTNLEKIEKKTKSRKFPDNIQALIQKELNLLYLNEYIFNYSEHNDFQRPVKNASDFTFLSCFDLNDSTVFHGKRHAVAFQKILSDNILSISPIEEIPVEKWLQNVKSIMPHSIGSEKGIFYDLLAAHAYYRQIETDIKPLSDKQIENIRSYFRNKAYIELLLEANSRITGTNDVKTNETPDVPLEKLADAIVSKYKGKVVVVDFWATWCGPCIQAMDKSKEMKNEMQDKNVVFVYITNPTSEDKKRYEISRQTGGEQYFINMPEWNYISKQFKIDTIPTYLIFDTQGVLKHNLTGFPGVTEMRKKIEELLS
jgi:thiol-disulfide isomerase/thioredoxin